MTLKTEKVDIHLAYLKKVIASKGYKSIRSFAEDTNSPTSSMQNIFQRNDFQNCTIKILVSICETLEISPNFILNKDFDDNTELTSTEEINKSTDLMLEREKKQRLKERELLERELLLIQKEEELLKRERNIKIIELQNLDMMNDE